jgi:hypothetical protein
MEETRGGQSSRWESCFCPHEIRQDYKRECTQVLNSDYSVSKMHKNSPTCIGNFKNFRGVIPQEPMAEEDSPLPAPSLRSASVRILDTSTVQNVAASLVIFAFYFTIFITYCRLQALPILIASNIHFMASHRR